jgi:hypothetical protein
MNTRNKQKIRHEIKKLLNSIANSRSSEYYNLLDDKKRHRSRRNMIIICLAMLAGLILGVAAMALFKEYASLQQYSLPTPDIEELKPKLEEIEIERNEQPTSLKELSRQAPAPEY